MKHFFTSILLFFFSFSFCQDLSFLDVLNLKTRKLNEVKEILLAKDFKIVQEHYSKEMKFGDVQFLTKNKIADEIPTSISFYYKGDDLLKKTGLVLIFSTKKYLKNIYPN